MKKLFILLTLGLLSFAFISCDRSPETTLDPVQSTTEAADEQIAAPTNLRFDEKILRWDPVNNAQGYIVYIDGVQAEIVSTNEYDFTDNMAESILFQVVTQAPRGTQDSEMSASLSFSWDRAGEITAVQNVLATYPMTQALPPEFAEELVDKGMDSQDTQLLLSGMAVFETEIQAVSDPQGGLVAVNNLLANMDNTEAIVSAMVKVMLPPMLESEIDRLDQAIIDFNDPNDVELRAYLQSLLTEIETNPDLFILAIVNTVDYLISVEQMITADFLTSIEDLATGTTAPSGAEVVAILDEVAYILRVTMPTEAEVMSLVVLANTIQSIFGVPEITTVNNYDEKVVSSILLSVELFVDFIDSITADEVNGIITEIENSDDFTGAELAIMAVKIFDRFITQEEVTIAQLKNVYSDADKIALYDHYIAQLIANLPEDAPAGLDVFITNIDFATILALQVVLEDGFEAVIDEFIAMDGEILRQFVILDGYESYWDGMTSTYSNDVLGITYLNYDEYDLARTETEMTAQQYGFDLYNAYLQTIDASELDMATSFIIDDIISNFVNNLDFETIVTPSREYEHMVYSYTHASVTTNNFVDPGTLGSEEFFSTRWGIAFKYVEMDYYEFLEITYVDSASPLLDMRDGMGGVYSLQVGDYISYFYSYDSIGTMIYNNAYMGAEDVRNTLDFSTQLWNFVIKVPGPDPEPELTVTEANALISLLDNFLEEVNPDTLALQQSFTAYIVANDVIVNAYDAYEYDYNNVDDYAMMIYILQHYNAFMTSTNRTLVDGILDEVYLALKDTALDEFVPLTNTEIDALDLAIDGFLDALDTQAALVVGMDYENLTAADIIVLDALIVTIDGHLQNIGSIINPPEPI